MGIISLICTIIVSGCAGYFAVDYYFSRKKIKLYIKRIKELTNELLIQTNEAARWKDAYTLINILYTSFGDKQNPDWHESANRTIKENSRKQKAKITKLENLAKYSNNPHEREIAAREAAKRKKAI